MRAHEQKQNEENRETKEMLVAVKIAEQIIH